MMANSRGRKNPHRRHTMSSTVVALSLGLAAFAPVLHPSMIDDATPRISAVHDETDQVQLKGVRLRRETGRIVVTGRVQNTSSRPCRLLEVVGEVADAEGTPLTLESALTTDQHLTPGETAGFRLILDEWPRSRDINLTFRQLSGSIHTTPPIDVDMIGAG